MLRQPTSGKEMVITSSTATFFEGGGEGEPATFLGGGIEPLLLSERFALLVSDPLFLLFSLFLHRKGSLLPSKTCRLMTFLAEFFYGLCPVLTEFSLQYLLCCCSRLKYKFFEFIVAFEILRVSLFDNIQFI